MAVTSPYVANSPKDAMLFEMDQDHLLSGLGIGPAQVKITGHDY
jgi:hypothetical protein